MALIPCTSCGNTISDKAVACPKCGSPMTAAAAATAPSSTAAARQRGSAVFCAACGGMNVASAGYCQHCGHRFGMPPPAAGFAAAAVATGGTFAQNRAFSSQATDDGSRVIAIIADYEKASAVIWLIIGILQILSLVLIIAGIWNIYAATTRFKIAPIIRARDARIPAAFESITGLIVFAVLNLVLGGVIGVLFVAFDFYIRHLVLENRHLFTSPPVNTAALQV